MERGDFLRKTMRLGILAGIAGVTAHLFLNKQIDLSCTAKGLCGTCPEFKNCTLDKALKTKENGR